MSVNKFGTNRELDDMLRIIWDVELLKLYLIGGGGAKFARENRQLIMGDHQNIDKLLEALDPVTTRLAAMDGNHQDIDKFLKVVNRNTLSIAENQRVSQW